MDVTQRLFEVLRTRAFKRGEFRLTSGRTSSYYIDSKMAVLSAEGAYLTGKAVFAALREQILNGTYHPGDRLLYLTIAEELTVCDPANTAWQVDLAISCSKLGEHDGLSIAERRTFFLRGRKILQELKQARRLHPSQDYVAWFDAELAKLPSQ